MFKYSANHKYKKMAIKSMHVVGKTLDDVWFQLLSNVYHHGRRNRIDSGSFEGGVTYRIEFDFVSGTIEYPTTRPLAPIMPGGVPPVTTDDAIMDYFTNYLMNPELEPNEEYRYATWIRGGKARDSETKIPDQLEWCIKHYKKHGFGTNHCVIQVGSPDSSLAYDRHYKNDTERGTSPCLRTIDTKIIEDEGKTKLLFNVYFRSWDLFGGWPENLGGITLLMEYMAERLKEETGKEVEPGSLSFCSKGLHVYSFHIEPLKARLHISG